MFAGGRNTHLMKTVPVAVALLLALAMPISLFAAKKKPAPAPQVAPAAPEPDWTTLQIPGAPAIARIRFTRRFFGEKLVPVTNKAENKRQGWMDKLAGTPDDKPKGLRRVPPQLLTPMGVAFDSKGKVYVSDQKMGGIFIFELETETTHYIRNGVHAHFVLINGIVIDDLDRLFVADGGAKQVLVFDANHNVITAIQEGLKKPDGVAVDNENRYLYVTDVELDQVFVFDLDTFKLIRKMGTTGRDHRLTTPGDFAEPTAVAVDKDGNVFVVDTLNCRIEMFDADGNFVRTWGKNGDGPGAFARPKGVAVDSDGHVWVVDQMLDRVSIFSPEGVFIIGFGGHGKTPAKFNSLDGISIDGKNRVFTIERYPSGEVQQFRYITDAEAEVEFKKRQADKEAKVKAVEDARKAAADSAAPAKPADPAVAPGATAPSATPK